MKKIFLFCVSLFFISATLVSQTKIDPYERFQFEPDLQYDQTIPSPESFLGYRLGERMTLYAHVVDYFQTLAEASNKITINNYGDTYEGRKLYNIVISSEENQSNMDAIKERHMQLLNSKASQEAVNDVIENDPVFTSFSYNIHGNEFSTTEAALQTAYRMVAAQDATTAEVLDNSVIIMFVCINPDGRDRYAYWYTSVQRATGGEEPRDLEHYAPWPNGRTNHYWFDLNRDWIWGVHPESRGQTREYLNWMPQVHVDYHEQGYNANYFTSPGTTPRNKLLPDDYEAWSDTFGRANVAQFDKNKLNYFTRERFDFFYPSYGSSYPSVMGAIGMLTEQGGIGGGTAIENNDGYVLTFRQRVFDHYTTSVATIKKSAERRQQLLQYSRDAWQPSSSKSEAKAYIFPDDKGNGYLDDLLKILQHHKVDVEVAQNAFTTSVVDYRTGGQQRKSFEDGSFIVKMDQPLHLFISSLLDRNMIIEDSVMYDMSTWSAPLAYNLEAYYTKTPFEVKTEKLSSPARANLISHTLDTYAYVIDWNQRYAPKALAMLWDKGYRVRIAEEPASSNEGSYSAGSLIVLVGRNLEKKDQMVADMEAIAKEAQVNIRGFKSGRMESGYDLAASGNRPVKKPKVALLVEPPFNTYTCGQIYFLFDQETKLPVERIRTSVLQQTSLPMFRQRYGGADLNDYDVLILAGGGNNLKKVFAEKELETLKDWVNKGGVLVATESAAEYFIKKNSKSFDVHLDEVKKDSSDAAKYVSYADREDYEGKKRIPGAAMNGKIDTTHPLAFGVKEEVYSLKFGNKALKPMPGFETVGHYDKDPDKLLVAGYSNEENLKHLAGKTFAGVKKIGRGKVVYLLDNTQYRMFWRGPSRMMQNAVMLLPGF